MTDWGDVAARARGLSGRLLTMAQRRALCLSRDVAGLGAQLSAMELIAPPAGGLSTSPRTIEAAVRRRAGGLLRVLDRWAGDRAPQLAPLFDDEDRRSLRALVRGATAGVPVEERLAVLIPTRSLPIRALDQLARMGDVAGMAALLVAWQHPFGAGLASEARHQHPDLFRFDVAVTRAFAERASAVARSADAPMRRFVERTIDLENLWSAIALAERSSDVEPAALFVAGGRLLRSDDLVTAARGNAAALESHLRARLSGTPLGAALEPGDRAREDRALEAMVAEFRRIALSDPLSTAPVIAFVLRQRLEVRVLLRLTWGIALGATPRALEHAIGAAA